MLPPVYVSEPDLNIVDQSTHSGKSTPVKPVYKETPIPVTMTHTRYPAPEPKPVPKTHTKYPAPEKKVTLHGPLLTSLQNIAKFQNMKNNFVMEWVILLASWRNLLLA